MATNNTLRKPQDSTKLSDFIFEEFVQRLNDAALIFLLHDTINTVMVRLDRRGN